MLKLVIILWHLLIQILKIDHTFWIQTSSLEFSESSLHVHAVQSVPLWFPPWEKCAYVMNSYDPLSEILSFCDNADRG
jgi:hypothetical protein